MERNWRGGNAEEKELGYLDVRDSERDGAGWPEISLSPRCSSLVGGGPGRVQHCPEQVLIGAVCEEGLREGGDRCPSDYQIGYGGKQPTPACPPSRAGADPGCCVLCCEDMNGWS